MSASLTKRLHLGSGRYIFDGWTNVDIDPGIGGICWDLERVLPLPTGSIQFIFTEHFIEHISREQCLALLTECRRVLKRDGVLRASTPNLHFLIQQYDEDRLSEWHDVGWRPATACAMVNEGLHNWGHRFLYDESELALLLREAGFTRVDAVKWRESSYEALRDLERRPFHNELIFEARI
jgi:predicted SAM-dependent methyltransferase